MASLKLTSDATDFGNTETSFLRSYANLLAAAVERLQGSGGFARFPSGIESA
jgi:hypothetical protein